MLRDAFNLGDSRWIRSIFVGSERFVAKTKQELGITAKGREVVKVMLAYQLREPKMPYMATFGPENDDIEAENSYFEN